MAKTRLDQMLVVRQLTSSRSQAESYIKLGYAKVNNKVITKPGFLVNANDKIELTIKEQYVSRAALKLASVLGKLKLDFRNKIVLDVGSSTGGFTDYVLKHGAKKVIAVEVGTNQLHPSLHGNPNIELFEQTDIRNFKTTDNIDVVLGEH
jgi:23S rRNA (cytidine1920-2'-O)/16S rRNA (cytidine1409-2'-O)-methyltransferase